MNVQWLVLIAAVVGLLIALMIYLAPTYQRGVNTNMSMLCDINRDPADLDPSCLVDRETHLEELLEARDARASD